MFQPEELPCHICFGNKDVNGKNTGNRGSVELGKSTFHCIERGERFLYECIVFDVDGTLIDTENVIIRALQLVLERRGRYFPDEKLDFVLGIPGDISLSKLGIKDCAGAIKEWNEHIQNLAGDIQLFDGIDLLIEALDKRKISKGIVTSKTRKELSDDFGPFGLMERFPHIVCVDDIPFHKPHPAPLLRCLESASVPARLALYIGDTIYDAECARAAGVDFALAGWGAKSESNIPCDLYFNNPLDLLPLLDGMR